MKKYKIEFIIGLCIALCLTAVGFYATRFGKFGLSQNTVNWGTFGDYIGGVLGSVFSFASVILIYLTFKSQQRTSVLQQFESTFFNMLNIHREMMKSVKADVEPGKDEILLKGEDFFQGFEQRLHEKFIFMPNFGSRLEVRAVIESYYEDEYSIAGATLGPYYRHLYHFIKYTNGSDVFGQKKKYMDIIQAQMSDSELYCLFYNAICYGKDKALPLLDTYSFLENIERKSLSFDFHKEMFYPNTKFKYFSKDVPLSELD